MNYTKQAKEVLKIAKEFAKKCNHPYVGTEHLLIGLGRVYSGVAGQVLEANGVTEENVIKVINELVTPVLDHSFKRKAVESPRLQFILDEAKEEALHLKATEIGTEHMLLAILNDMDCVASRILQTLDTDMQKLYTDIFTAVGTNANDYFADLQGDARLNACRRYGVIYYYRPGEKKSR